MTTKVQCKQEKHAKDFNKKVCLIKRVWLRTEFVWKEKCPVGTNGKIKCCMYKSDYPTFIIGLGKIMFDDPQT